MKTSLILVLALAAVTAVGCGSSEATTEQYNESRKNARMNCQSAADNYLRAQAGPTAEPQVVIMDSDSSISKKHLQGDGTCSGHFVVNGLPTRAKLWCSSIRMVGGCKPVQPKGDGTPNPNLDHSTPIEK